MARHHPAVRAWAARHNVELCLTPTYASWANPIEAQFGQGVAVAAAFNADLIAQDTRHAVAAYRESSTPASRPV